MTASSACHVNWEAVTAAATVASVLVLGASAWLIRNQIKEARRAMYAQSLAAAVSILDDELAVHVATHFFQVRGRNDLSIFTGTMENIPGRPAMYCAEAASILCGKYDAVGAMIRHGAIPAKMILSTRAETIRGLWAILFPHVEARRNAENNRMKWADFEFLAAMAGRS